MAKRLWIARSTLKHAADDRVDAWMAVRDFVRRGRARRAAVRAGRAATARRRAADGGRRCSAPLRGPPTLWQWPTTSTLRSKLGALLRFINSAPLTETIAELEYALGAKTSPRSRACSTIRRAAGDVLEAALFARQRLSRISDIIHGVAVSLALPRLLQPGETLRRPSHATANDPSRPFDIDADRRIAEFKLARCDGHDAMRKRQLFKDSCISPPTPRVAAPTSPGTVRCASWTPRARPPPGR
jgi:hypothetical protein